MRNRELLTGSARPRCLATVPDAADLRKGRLRRFRSAHAAKLFVPNEQFEWLAGEGEVRRFEHPDAKFWSRAFCPNCGAGAPWESRKGGTMVVPGGALDDDPGERPERSIFFASRAPWYVPVKDLDAFDEYPK